MKNCKAFYDWCNQLFWEVGITIIALLLGKFSHAREMIFWIGIHLTHKGECTGRKPFKGWRLVLNRTTRALGLVVTSVIVWGAYSLFDLLMKWH